MTTFEYSAGAFIYRYERGSPLFLILKKRSGEYDLPKGHIEKGESDTEAAKREILEETGITAEFDGFFSESTKYFFYRNGDRIAKGVKFFLAEAGSSKVRISHEHLSYDWCSYETAVKRLKYKDIVQLMPRVIEYVRRKKAMHEMNDEYSRLPGLAKGWSLSSRFVPGEGRLDASLMLIGQAPGANEDRQLRPFIGRSGKLLDSVLDKSRINRKEVYITSVVQFFPPKNRMPTPKEAELCKSFLFRQMELIRPRYAVLLGNLASESVLGIGEVKKNHGKEILRNGIRYFITLHPSASLRFKENHVLMLNDFKKLAGKIGKKALESR
ncbi:MAG: uracil-DNA glycosylase family protein [Candidatus Micrarchaeaceae archaeon]